MIFGSRRQCFVDPQHSAVILHLPLVGVADQNTFIDYSPAAHTVVGTNGVALSATQYKWPGASCYFATNKTLAITTDSSFSLSGDFTIEFWFYGSLNQCIFSNSAGTYLYNNVLFVNGTSIISSIGLNTDQSWKFVSISRDGETISVYENNVLKKSGISSATVNLTSLYIGFYKPGNNLYMTGYLQDFRITAGYVRPSTIPNRRFAWR